MTDLASSAKRASNSPAMAAMARAGLLARGFVYILIGWLAVQIARGHGTKEANQKGALATVAQHSFGTILLWLMGLGFAAYAIWRLSEAAFGTAVEGNKTSARLQSLVRGVVYAGFAVSTFGFIAGTSRQSQAQQQAGTTARLMRHSYGRLLIGLVGLVVVGVGVGMIVEGIRKKFQDQLRMEELHGSARTVVVRLGMVGTIARGGVFAIAGGLVVDAAVTFNASKSTGLDGALRTLADQPYGPVLLGLLAVGLIAFGLFGFAAARWAKT
jgi:hypothetical protein